jgi:single-stranded-DNA-specific exonuclease
VKTIKYKLIGNNTYENPIETILHNRGVNDKEKFLKPDKSVDIHYSKLKNIHRAAECLLQHIKKGDKAYIQADSDP